MSTGLKVGLVGTLLREEHLGLLPPPGRLVVVWAAKHFLIISVSFSFFGFSLATFRGCWFCCFVTNCVLQLLFNFLSLFDTSLVGGFAALMAGAAGYFAFFFGLYL